MDKDGKDAGGEVEKLRSRLQELLDELDHVTEVRNKKRVQELEAVTAGQSCTIEMLRADVEHFYDVTELVLWSLRELVRHEA